MYIHLSHPMESDCHAAVITELNSSFSEKGAPTLAMEHLAQCLQVL